MIRGKKACIRFLLRLEDEMCMCQKGDLRMCKVLESKSKLLRRDHNNQVAGSLLVYHVTLFVKKQKQSKLRKLFESECISHWIFLK